MEHCYRALGAVPPPLVDFRRIGHIVAIYQRIVFPTCTHHQRTVPQSRHAHRVARNNLHFLIVKITHDLSEVEILRLPPTLPGHQTLQLHCYLYELGVDLGRERRVHLELRPNGGEVQRRDIGDEDDSVGVPHAHAGDLPVLAVSLFF